MLVYVNDYGYQAWNEKYQIIRKIFTVQ